jgi:hypothetical protein
VTPYGADRPDDASVVRPERAGGGPTLLRVTSVGDSTVRSGCGSAAISLRSSAMPARATARKSGRTVVSGLGDVVEADQADVAGHAAAVLAERPHDAQGQVVVRREHRGDLRHPGEHLPGPVAGRRRPVPGEQRRHLAALGEQRLAPAGDPALRVEPVGRTADVPHRRVPGLEQVLGGQPRALLLVDHDQGARALRVAVDRHQGDVRRDVLHRLTREHHGRDDDDARHAVIEMAFHRLGHRTAVEAVRGRHADGEARRLGGALERGEQRRRPVERAALGDHPDDPGPTRHEGAGGVVPPVPELLDGPLDALAGLVAHAGVPVEDPRHGLVRDARPSGDVHHPRLSGQCVPTHPDSWTRSVDEGRCAEHIVRGAPVPVIDGPRGRERIRWAELSIVGAQRIRNFRAKPMAQRDAAVPIPWPGTSPPGVPLDLGTPGG